MSDMQSRFPTEPPQGGRDTPAAQDLPARGSTATREGGMATHGDMATHPDIVEMRERYARMAESPRVSLVEGLIVLTGLYTAISPWVVHFQPVNTIMAINNLVLGLALAVMGIGMTVRPELMLRLGWTISAIGAWLIVSPWVASLGHTATRPLIWNNAFVGGVAVLLGLAAMGALRAGSGGADAAAAGHRAARGSRMRHG